MLPRQLLSISVLLLIAGAPIFAQTPQHPKVEVPLGTLVIDGAKNPELIPDPLALRLFYIAAKTTKNSSSASATAQYRSAQAFLDKLGAASPSDAALLKSHVADWAAKYNVPYALGQPLTAKYYQDLEADSAAELAVLKASLSSNGLSLLMEELTRRKATIQQFKFPPMGH